MSDSPLPDCCSGAACKSPSTPRLCLPKRRQISPEHNGGPYRSSIGTVSRPSFVRSSSGPPGCRIEHYQTMVGDEYGIRWVRNYLLSDESPLEGLLMGNQSPMRDLYPELRDLRQDEHPFGYKYVRQFDTMMIEPPTYLNAMLRDVQIAGGRVVVRELKSKSDIADLSEPVIMNCTGLGARDLVGDAELIPIKGQLSVLLPQPEIDYTVLQDHYYMFPRRDGILLGGTFERNESDLAPNREAEKRVIAAHQRIFAPLLKT